VEGGAARRPRERRRPRAAVAGGPAGVGCGGWRWSGVRRRIWSAAVAFPPPLFFFFPLSGVTSSVKRSCCSDGQKLTGGTGDRQLAMPFF
jgi:hypothetical protein